MPTGTRCIEVKCTHKRKSPRYCNAYLGDFDIDHPHTDRFHCKDCNVTFEYSMDADSVITRSRVTKRNKYSVAIAIVEA